MKYQWYWKIRKHYNTDRRHTIGENWNTKVMSKIPKPYEVIIIRTDDTPLVKNKIPMLWKKHYNTDRQNSTSETRNTNVMEKIPKHYNTDRRHTTSATWNTNGMGKIRIEVSNYSSDRKHITRETWNTNGIGKYADIIIRIDDTPPVQHEIQMTWVKYEMW